MRVEELYNQWCESSYFDYSVFEELKAIEKDKAEIHDRFYKDLEFGTGGLRGVIGAGTNRMNIYTVRKATQGLANYIILQGKKEQGVAIAYDSRHMSPEFAHEAACCLNANGIPTYLFSTLAPTPMLSFAVRTLGCVAGIVITASHNPPEYNGYKVYWEDGAQITAPKDAEIIAQVNAVSDYRQMQTMEEKDAVASGLFHLLDTTISDQYLDELEKLVLYPEAIKQAASELKIVYTPLHGTGNIPVQQILKRLGFQHIYMVKEQQEPDGNFPTVSYPNPEDPKAFTLALELAKEVDADLVLATDPDADRLGIYAKDNTTGAYIPFTGNMSGMLICEYLLAGRKELGILPDNGAVVKTVVTTKMAEQIARAYDMELIQVLTGFKYIGEQIKFFEETGKHTYEFGFEESYGCLVGTHARDKDAIVAVMSLCEAAAYYHLQGKTLWDQMIQLYETYGYYKESLATKTLKGEEGAAKIQEMLTSLRENPPKEIAGFQVQMVSDYGQETVTDMIHGTISPSTLPKSNVLHYQLSEDAWFCVRPSGTEPKIKYYFGVKGNSLEDAAARLEALEKAVLGDDE